MTLERPLWDTGTDPVDNLELWVDDLMYMYDTSSVK